MDNFYRFKIGQFTCISVSDGGFNYPVESLFKDVPLEKAREYLEQVISRYGTTNSSAVKLARDFLAENY